MANKRKTNKFYGVATDKETNIYARAGKNVKLLRKERVMSSTKASLKRNKLKHISRDTRINVCQ